MIQKTEYVLEVASRARKPVTFHCPLDCPRGERIDILSEMLTHELAGAKVESDKKKREICQLKEGE